jgi:hypothetical protein
MCVGLPVFSSNRLKPKLAACGGVYLGATVSEALSQKNDDRSIGVGCLKHTYRWRETATSFSEVLEILWMPILSEIYVTSFWVYTFVLFIVGAHGLSGFGAS